MEKIGLFYSFNTTKTTQIAKKVLDFFGKEIEAVNAEDVTAEIFLSFKNIIMGVPTWFDGELPNYWDEFLPAMEEFKLKGKQVAIYGAGDQKGYPENFVDAIGIMAEVLESKGAEIIGHTSVEGYTFESSRARRGDKFVGLALDFENQAKKNNERVKNWCEQISKEFK